MSPDFSGAQVVVLSSIDWDAAWQRHQIFADQLAEAGHEVFFVENTGFRNPGLGDLPRLWRKMRAGAASAPVNPRPRGLHVVNPSVLPPTAGAFRRVNSGLLAPQLVAELRERGVREAPVVITYFATATTLELIRRLRPSLVVYDCASNFRAHPQAPRDFPQLEADLLRRADLVVCDSDYLYRQKQAEHGRVVQIHQGVSERFFDAAPPRPDHRRVCYYGTWVPDLDSGFLTALDAAGFAVTLSGFVKGPPPAWPPSVRRLNPCTLDGLVRRLEGFDVFLLPHRVTPFHLGVVPAKLYECMALGRPVLAVPLPSLEPYRDLIYISETPADWVRIARGLPETETPGLRRARIEIARRHTHRREFERLLAELRSAWARRDAAAAVGSERPGRWWSSRQLEAFRVGFTWIGFLYGLAKTSTLLTQVAAGRLLGPLHYGKANLVIALAAFLQILPMMGFPLALSKFVANEHSHQRRSILISTTLTVFLAWGLLWLAVLSVGHAATAVRLRVPDDILTHSILFSFCTAFYVVVSSPLLGLRRFAHRGVAEAIYGLSAPPLLLAFFLRGTPTFHALILSLCLSLAAGAAYSLWCLRPYLKPVFDPSAFRSISGYTVMATLNLLTAACIIGPGRLILNRHFTAHDVGIFSAYFTATAQIGLALIYILSSVIVPLASNPEGQADAWSTFRKVRLPMFALALGMFILTAVVGLMLFGRQYPFRWDWVLLFASAAALILLHGIATALFTARDFEGLRVSVTGSLIAGLGNLGLGLLLIPLWKITGAAAALAVAYLLSLGYYAAYARRDAFPPGVLRHARLARL